MLIGALAQYFFGFTIFVLSAFLVLLVLVQRGRGGGLTGALGGPGGQSAFGTKAGDLFTRITIGVATAWILLCATAVFMLRGRALPLTGGKDRPAVKSDMETGASSGTTGTGENTSGLSKIDLPNFSQPNADLPDLKPSSLVAPSEGAAKPATTLPVEPTTTGTPPAAAPAVESTAPPSTPDSPAPTGTDTPPDPK